MSRLVLFRATLLASAVGIAVLTDERDDYTAGPGERDLGARARARERRAWK